MGKVNGGDYVVLCKQGKRVWVLYTVQRKLLGSFSGENDFTFGETLKEAKISLEILAITNGGLGK